MKTKKHAVLDHPILAYALFALLVVIVSSTASTLIDTPLAYVLPGYGSELEYNGIKVMTASGVGAAIGAVLCVVLFRLIFMKEFNGMLKGKGLLMGLLFLLPFLIFHYAGSIVSWVQFGTASIFIAFLRATAPGFMEEIAFRGLGVANYMRVKNNDAGIIKIFWISSFVFGFVHMLNFFAGAPLLISLIQSVYAMGIGMALCAVYLRTGTLWPTIIAHLTVDFMEFIRADLGSSGGVMLGMGIGDWITIAAGVFAAGLGLYLIRKPKRQEIIDLWNTKWNKSEEAAA